MPKPCLFCGADGEGILSKEHVIPQWLIEHLGLPADDLMIQGVASSATNQLLETPRVHSSFNFIHGRVCCECNTGWMCNLEGIAKPILVPLIDRQRPIESLSQAESSIVGKWAAKTAYMHSWISPLRRPVQLDHLRVLCGDAGRLLPGVGTFGVQLDYKQPSAYLLSGCWPQCCQVERQRFTRTPNDAYKIGLQFRNLYLLTAFWPDPASLLTVAEGLHHPIFPPQDSLEYRPFDDFTVDEGPIAQLQMFTNWLAVSHL